MLLVISSVISILTFFSVLCFIGTWTYLRPSAKRMILFDTPMKRENKWKKPKVEKLEVSPAYIWLTMPKDDKIQGRFTLNRTSQRAIRFDKEGKMICRTLSADIQRRKLKRERSLLNTEAWKSTLSKRFSLRSQYSIGSRSSLRRTISMEKWKAQRKAQGVNIDLIHKVLSNRFSVNTCMSVEDRIAENKATLAEYGVQVKSKPKRRSTTIIESSMFRRNSSSASEYKPVRRRSTLSSNWSTVTSSTDARSRRSTLSGRCSIGTISTLSEEDEMEGKINPAFVQDFALEPVPEKDPDPTTPLSDRCHDYGTFDPSEKVAKTRF